MKKTLLFILAVCAVFTATAQTAKKFTMKNSADGQSELTVYLPEHPRTDGMAIVDCPGGGYQGLSMQNEGHDWAAFMNSNGIAYAILKYRMPKGDRNIPLSDAYQAMRTMRDSAQVWSINPHAVGIMGFSAGGHLASAVSTHADFEVRPDFSVLFYPVISMDERITHKGSCVNFLGDDRNNPDIVKQWSSDRAIRRHITPPALILTAHDDRTVNPVTNAIAYYTKMRGEGNFCSLMVWPTGGHGFGFRSLFKYHEQMKSELLKWLDELPLQLPGDKKIACVGNSITDGHGIEMAEQRGYPAELEKLLGKGYKVKNFGVSARTAVNNGDHPYMKERAWRDCLAWHPDVVIIKLGTNDTKPHNRENLAVTYPAAMQEMIDSLRSLPSNPRIYLCSPIPAIKDTWEITDSYITDVEIPALLTLAKKNRCEYIDLHTLFAPHHDLMLDDGIHPDQKGCVKMAEIISAALRSEPVYKDVNAVKRGKKVSKKNAKR